MWSFRTPQFDPAESYKLSFVPIHLTHACHYPTKGHRGSATFLVSRAQDLSDCGIVRDNAVSITSTDKHITKLTPLVCISPVSLGLGKECHVHIPSL